MQDGGPDARLQVLLGHARLSARKDRAQDLFEAPVRRLDREVHELDPEAFGHEPGVLQALGRSVARRHAHGDHVLGPERVGGDRRRQRGIDAARHPDDDLLKSLLAHVVVRGQDDCRIDLRGPRQGCGEPVHDRRFRPGPAWARNLQLTHLQLEALGALGLVPEPLRRDVDRLLGVDVAQKEVLDQRLRVGDRVAARVEDDAVAVEDQLVLPPDGVHPGDEGAVVGGPSADHRLSRRPLAVVVGRAVDVDQQPGAVLRLPRHRAGGEPAVLAHRKADAHAVEVDDRAEPSGLEVALLIEDAVVGQEDLVVDGLDLAVVDEGGRVEDLAVPIDEADDRRDSPGLCRDQVQLGQVVADEGGFEDQVLGRVSGDDELREAHDVGLGIAGALDPLDDEARVSAQVADRRVDLRERNPHTSNVASEAYLPFGCLTYFEKLRELSRERHTMLCVGLDPDPDRIEGGAAGALRHCREVVRQTEEHVCCFKPNSAFWEQYGPDGWKALLELREEAAGTPFLLDAKRGDMDNTMRAYARAVFGTLGMEAATVNPYLGSDSLAEFTSYGDRGVYVLCRTSNAGASELQHLESQGRPLYAHVVELAARLNGHGNVGLVIGATAPGPVAEVRRVTDLPFLLPGVGAQGGDVEASVRAAWNGDPASCLISASRSVLFAPDAAREAARLKAQINAAAGVRA